jgi:hypothetical protein
VNDGGKAITVSSNGVDCTNDASFQITQGTIEAWIKTTSADANFRAICGKELNYTMFVRNNCLFVYSWSDAQAITSGVTVNDGVRHHVAFVFDSNVVGGSQMYVDGVAAGAAFKYVKQADTSAFRVGCGLGTTNPFVGTIDAVAVYGTKLSAGRIAAHYAAG